MAALVHVVRYVLRRNLFTDRLDISMYYVGIALILIYATMLQLAQPFEYDLSWLPTSPIRDNPAHSPKGSFT